MIIEEKNPLLGSTLQGETKNFSIAANPKAYQVLTSNLYSDKIGSIVRELTCNAVDSHVAAGHRRPVKITLPSLDNFEFTVEDFGVGLSKDELLHVYTTFFKSSKTNTNEQMGGFGLGSKTPLSYTNAFTVRARKDGKEVNAMCFKGPDGLPQITIMGEKATSEPNGLKVSVPVEGQDTSRFAHSVGNQLYWLDMPLEIINGDFSDSFKTREQDVAKLKKDGIAFDVPRAPANRSVNVVIGGIAYGVSNMHIKNCSWIHALRTELFIECPIGYLDLTAGREEISYDDTTIARLDELLAKTNEQLKNLYKREDYATPVDYLADIDNTFRNLSSIKEFETECTWLESHVMCIREENGNFQRTAGKKIAFTSPFNLLLSIARSMKAIDKRGKRQIEYIVMPNPFKMTPNRVRGFRRAGVNFTVVVCRDDLAMAKSIIGDGIETQYADVLRLTKPTPAPLPKEEERFWIPEVNPIKKTYYHFRDDNFSQLLPTQFDRQELLLLGFSFRQIPRKIEKRVRRLGYKHIAEFNPKLISKGCIAKYANKNGICFADGYPVNLLMPKIYAAVNEVYPMQDKRDFDFEHLHKLLNFPTNTVYKELYKNANLNMYLRRGYGGRYDSYQVLFKAAELGLVDTPEAVVQYLEYVKNVIQDREFTALLLLSDLIKWRKDLEIPAAHLLNGWRERNFELLQNLPC